MTTPNSVSAVSRSCTTASHINSSRHYFEPFRSLVDHLPYSAIDSIVDELMHRYELGQTVFLFGNGGSASLASHFACDLGKGTVVDGNPHRRLRVIALTDNIPLMTAWANDSCYENVFAEQLRNLVSAGDVAFAISGSGNSPNVLAGLKLAKAAGAVTMGLTGYRGGKMKALCDYCVTVPSDNMQIIEDFHLSVAHAVFTVIRSRISQAVHSNVLAQASASG